MSILITNEEFPQSCWGCPCCSVQDNGFAGWDHYCNLLDEFVNDYHHSRHKLCPLIEVPDTYNIETRSLANNELKEIQEEKDRLEFINKAQAFLNGERKTVKMEYKYHKEGE